MTVANGPGFSKFPPAKRAQGTLLHLAAGATLLIAILPAMHASGLASGARQAAPQSPQATAANGDSVYQQLRKITAGGKAVAAKELVLKRDAGTFTFHSGNFIFLTPVEGKVTGAVFVGTAAFSLDPPIAIEKKNLQLLTKSSEMVETFSTAVFRFTDNTAEEIEAKGSAPTGPVASPAENLLSANRTTLRKDLHYNLDGRILEDVLGSQPGDFFCAFIKGEKYSGKEIYVMDPHGVPSDFIGVDVAPEEVAFATYAESKVGIWAAFHYSDEYPQGRASGRQPNNAFRIVHQKLDTTIEKSGLLTGTATATVVAFANGIRVLLLHLFSNLRVKSVTDEKQKPLSFIQENKDEDYQFFVILPQQLSAGRRATFTTTYTGPDAVYSAGFENYYPVARTSWYPSSYSNGNYATYDLTFRIPKGLTMVAPGTKTSDTTEGDRQVSQWKVDVPIPEVGFNLGRFKEEDAKLTDQGVTVETYANVDTPGVLAGIRNLVPNIVPLGTFNTTGMIKKALGEGQLAVPLYTDYFGPLPYKRFAITQQLAMNYGQSFAEIVFLPITAFLGSTTRFGLGMNDPTYFVAVGPHEIAHQWWGNTVGWDSYRDQWMSEGFAHFSASLFLQTYFKDGSYDKFWQRQHTLLTEKDEKGYRAIEVGPVTLGYRLASSRAGFSVPFRLIYPKGAYILNMIRMMMWSNDTQDEEFKQMMHDFVQAYTDRPATTEDFKATVERHMNAAMNLTGDGSMSWFFDEYVYGTALPSYKFDYSFSQAADGSVALQFKIEQSGVDPSFRMLVPVYIELPSGGAFRVGAVPLTGNTTYANSVTLRGLAQRPKRAMINYYHDVLCTQN